MSIQRSTFSNTVLKPLGNIATSGTRTPLVSSTPSVLAVHEVRICALAANSAPIYIGDSTVTTTNGFELVAGGSISVRVNDPSKIYLISAAAQNARAFYV